VVSRELTPTAKGRTKGLAVLFDENGVPRENVLATRLHYDAGPDLAFFVSAGEGDSRRLALVCVQASTGKSKDFSTALWSVDPAWSGVSAMERAKVIARAGATVAQPTLRLRRDFLDAAEKHPSGRDAVGSVIRVVASSRGFDADVIEWTKRHNDVHRDEPIVLVAADSGFRQAARHNSLPLGPEEDLRVALRRQHLRVAEDASVEIKREDTSAWDTADTARAAGGRASWIRGA
jgi:hypothetical protein